MHKEGVVYRDLKPENILIDTEGYLRITDFGMSKISKMNDDEQRDRTTTFCGTIEYMAPEMMQDKPYTFSVDWFSFGILLFELLTGENPFKSERDEATDSQKVEANLKKEEQILKKYEGKSTLSAEAYDLLEKLLRYDPEYRIGCRDPGVAEIKQHPFFSDIDWALILRKGMVAPFIPKITKGETDVSNFDKEFTNMTMEQTPTEAYFMNYQDEAQFSNFTYVHNEMNQAM